jgi:adenosylhomocysteine nucleosidase
MTRVAIIAAIPGELKPLIRGWRHESRNGADLWHWRHAQGEWVAACAGMGIDAASRAFAEIEREGAVDSVISTGWAGALREKVGAGRAYTVSGVVDARSGERIATTAPSGGYWLVTCDGIASHAEKERLAASHGAELVDMEAAEVGRLAARRGIPFCCIKGVSDGLADQLPDFNGFISSNGQFQALRFILFAILRPWHWPALARLGQNSKKAAQSIRDALLHVLDEREILRKPDVRSNPQS